MANTSLSIFTDEEWGVIASAMYAHAHKASATPGRENPLGLEFDLQLYIREFDRLNINVVYGHFFPFSAFNRLDDNGEIVATPESAITLQGMIGLEFLSQQQTKKQGGQSMWGGRFSESTDDFVARLNASVRFDKRLWAYDIEGSRIHAKMLERQGILTDENHGYLWFGTGPK